MIVFDTSGLMSLEAGRILELVTESIDCVIPERVAQELKGLASTHGFEGNIAKNILSLVGNVIQVQRASKTFQEGELEAAQLAKDLKADFVITDDMRDLKKVERMATPTQVRFSTMIVYALYLKGKITKSQGWSIINHMAVKRDWKDNLIFESAKILWK